MTPERYRQLNALADAAQQMEPERRTVFLNEVCGSDRELREQVEAMLEGESGSADFLDKTVLEVLAADMLAQPTQRDLSGKRIRNYEVTSRLGAGGIGEVWLARDVNLNREVAIKVLSPRYAGDPYHVRRFQQEARAASSLNHPNIVTVYEIGETEGALFIAQERVAGDTIRQRLARGHMEVLEMLQIAIQAAAALGAAHAAGVVHRDIKPENVMVRPDGLVKVLDFGLARFVERQTGTPSTVLDSNSLPGFVLGTVRYMSPEQIRGLPVDGRSDIFSLGVMLYEMAAGLPPFSGPTPTDTLAAILTNDPLPLGRHTKGLPPHFERLVQRCLAKDAAARYASAEELRDDLQRLLVQFDRTAMPSKRRGLMIAGACAAVAALAWYLLLDRRPPADSFNSMQITRLATRAEPADAAISHDGKLLAYVISEAPGQSILIRSSSDSDERAAIPAEAGEHSGLVFSPDDVFLYYRRRAAENVGDLYRVPVKGGAAERVTAEVSGAAAFSPDGKRIAFVRLRPSSWEASLMVSNADGSREFTLSRLRRPRYFDQHSVAWSPDGRSIACFSGETVRYSDAASQLVEVRVQDGRQHTITKRTWNWPQSVAWSPKGDFLIVTAANRGNVGYQLWMVLHGNGAVTRLTNDLNNYDRVTLANDGKTLATVQSETSGLIWVAAGGDSARAVRISAVPLHSRRVALAWTPDGRIVYSDPAGDNGNLWAVDAEGRHPRRLTTGPDGKEQIVITRDGRYVVYRQNGNIWRIDLAGSNPLRLTQGPLDVHPDVTPDGRSVIYASFAEWAPGVGGEPTLWKTSITGGDAIEISPLRASWPRVSPDGKRLGFIYFMGRDPRFSAARLATTTLDAAGAFKLFEPSPSAETPVLWSPDGKGLDYVADSNGVGNVWRQPADGGKPSQVTKFGSEELYTFAWSKNGRLACVRGTTTRSIVLMENFH